MHKSWPFLRRGINFWSKDKLHLYLLGNPLVYWSATISIFVYFAAKGAVTILEKRGIAKDFGGKKKKKSMGNAKDAYTSFFLALRIEKIL